MSGITVNLICCTDVILNEIQRGVRMKDVAVTYAMSIKSEVQEADKPNWPRINKAIMDRWGPRGLTRVKNAAWRHLEAAAAQARSAADVVQLHKTDGGL